MRILKVPRRRVGVFLVTKSDIMLCVLLEFPMLGTTHTNRFQKGYVTLIPAILHGQVISVTVAVYDDVVGIINSKYRRNTIKLWIELQDLVFRVKCSISLCSYHPLSFGRRTRVFSVDLAQVVYFVRCFVAPVWWVFKARAVLWTVASK